MEPSLGERSIWKGKGVKRKCTSKEDCIMYVPLLDTLQVLLKNEAFLFEVSIELLQC